MWTSSPLSSPRTPRGYLRVGRPRDSKLGGIHLALTPGGGLRLFGRWPALITAQMVDNGRRFVDRRVVLLFECRRWSP